MAAVLQFSFCCQGLWPGSAPGVFSVENLAHTWEYPAGSRRQLAVVNGWRAPEGSLIQDRVQVVNSDSVVVVRSASDIQAGPELDIVASLLDFGSVRDGQYVVRIYDGEEFLLEYPVDIRTKK
jgi:hypothetical protein